MKNVWIILLLLISSYIYGNDGVIYIKKQNLNKEQYEEIVRNSGVVDDFIVYTDLSLLAKIEKLNTTWDRNTLREVMDEFAFSPEHFSIMIDTLSNVVIRQSGDLPTTPVGKIAIAGFAWQIAGPHLFRLMCKILFVPLIFIFWFWSWKKNLGTNVFVTKSKKIGWRKREILEKLKYTREKLFGDESKSDDAIKSAEISTAIHGLGFIVSLLIVLFVL